MCLCACVCVCVCLSVCACMHVRRRKRERKWPKIASVGGNLQHQRWVWRCRHVPTGLQPVRNIFLPVIKDGWEVRCLLWVQKWGGEDCCLRTFIMHPLALWARESSQEAQRVLLFTPFSNPNKAIWNDYRAIQWLVKVVKKKIQMKKKVNLFLQEFEI